MSEPRPHSVLFGVPMPEPGVLTAGQRWTAALAVVLATALLLAPDGTDVLATAADTTTAPAVGQPAAGATPAPTSATANRPPPAPPPAEPLPPPPDPAFPLTTPTEPAPPHDGGDDAPEDVGGPEPAPPEDGDAPPEEEPEPCAVPVPPLLAGAGLCPGS